MEEINRKISNRYERNRETSGERSVVKGRGRGGEEDMKEYVVGVK